MQRRWTPVPRIRNDVQWLTTACEVARTGLELPAKTTDGQRPRERKLTSESVLTVITDGYVNGQQVRRILGISKAKFLQMVNAGELEAIKVGSHFRVSEESIRAYIERNRVTPGRTA